MSTRTVQDVIDWARSYPALTAVLGNPVAGYGGTAPGIEIANDLLDEIFQKPFAFKWNRSAPAPIITNQYQQDYSTSITDLGWLENATVTDINSTQTPAPTGPLPVVREIMPTSLQRNVERLSWVENSQAICGKWAANTTFTNPVTPGGVAPKQPLLQIKDPNGNIQVVTTFGTTGAIEPTDWAQQPGQTTTDGSVTWTCIDPNGITWRISPLPPQSGKVFLIQPYYQRKPQLITSANSTWSGIPDSEQRMVKSGFLALAFKAAGDNRADKEYLLFRDVIDKAVGAEDREPEGFSMYPANFWGSRASGTASVPPGTFDRLPL